MKKIYMIGGKARHGKDTVANYIRKYYENNNQKSIILQISTPLKFYASKVLNWDGSEESKPREFLQHLGVDIIRKNMGEKFLINRLIDDIKILFEFCDVIIVSDVRMPIEFEEIKCNFNNVKNIFIDRVNYNNNLLKDESKHITETALDSFNNYDYIVKNDGSLEDLEKKIFTILKEEAE